MVRRATRFSAASCPGSVERTASVHRLMRTDGTQIRVRVSRETWRGAITAQPQMSTSSDPQGPFSARARNARQHAMA